MKIVFLILSFVVVLILIRLLAVKLREYLRVEAFKKRQQEIIEERSKEYIIDNDETNDSKLVLSSNNANTQKTDIDTKYIGKVVHREKNGRFAKKELNNV